MESCDINGAIAAGETSEIAGMAQVMEGDLDVVNAAASRLEAAGIEHRVGVAGDGVPGT